MTLATLFASMVLAGVARAQDTTVSKGYAPVIAASNARRDAAAKMLVDWQAKRDGLAKAQTALEKQLNGLAAKPAMARTR